MMHVQVIQSETNKSEGSILAVDHVEDATFGETSPIQQQLAEKKIKVDQVDVFNLKRDNQNSSSRTQLSTQRDSQYNFPEF